MIISDSIKQIKLLATCFIVSMLIDKAKCTATDHCYSDIGCFPLSDEFYHPRYRPFNVRPWHRSRIKTSFELYSRQHPDGFVLKPWNKLNLIRSRFNPMLETKIIIPGWLDNIHRALWVRRLKDSFLWLWKPVNIIVIHWKNFTPYTIATANTRVVGAEIANLLKSIEHQLNYDRSYYHLIGHSLGAHIAGYCGDRIPGLGRITALDPARPFFQHMPKCVRLDRGDAKFVDAIHSDFTPENAIFLLMSFGMTTPVGHLDFYPNGPPLLQAGCLRDTLLSVQRGIQRGIEHSSLSIAFLESIRYLTACDHQRSHEWFIESITNRECVFVGVRCNEFDGLINGQCTCDDSRSACAIMGIHADQMYVNSVHEDLWPVTISNKRPSQQAVKVEQPHWRPPQTPHLLHEEADDAIHQQLTRPMTKEQIYSQLKFQANNLRQSSPLNLFDELLEDFKGMEDVALIDYLRVNLFEPNIHPLQRPIIGGSEQDDDFLLKSRNAFPSNEHPKLMSDLDRDIEHWYEGSSRWYLKTNNRPSYCVNQYQVLVYLGPLRSTRGHHHIRANLILSIIGSKGQLMNQRFVPRSANLDSFTMQPFFILLEGSYSLGTILSVAIGWEARIDPDPIQATISFHSNLLESMQSFWPTYNAKHPWLSETIKYDHSDAFRWMPPATGSNLLSHVGIDLQRSQKLDKRSSVKHEKDSVSSQDCSLGSKQTGSHCSMKRSSLTSVANDNFLRQGGSLIDASHKNGYEDDLLKGRLALGDNVFKTSQLSHEKHKPIDRDDELLESILTNEEMISAKLHNVGIHNLDRDLEDSIVVNKVLVSPLHANYGKDGSKIGKIFCPPHPNYRLQKDKTVRLVPNLIGNCPNQNQYFHEPVRAIRIKHRD